MAMAGGQPPAEVRGGNWPYRERRVLMQLRDDKEGIAFPGKWGFFGGGIEPGESPEGVAPGAELLEEVADHATTLVPLGCGVIPEVEVFSHAFGCLLEVDIEALEADRGHGYGLVRFR